MKKQILKRSILIIVITYLFLLSIKLMSSSFKLFGSGFAEQIISYTTNPFVGLFVGILATTLVQSSSVSTSVVVGLTASGALNVANAIPIIMGANIGTSVTNTIVSLGHITKKEEFRRAFEVATVHDFFNFIVVLILFPLELSFHFLEHFAVYLSEHLVGTGLDFSFNNPLNYVIKPGAHLVQELLSDNGAMMLVLAFFLLFFSLRSFVKVMKPLAKEEFKETINKHLLKSPGRTFGIGLLITIIVQSSSVSSSLIVPLAGIGVFSLTRIFPYILGANIGTTITALLASLVTGSPAAVTVAIEHVLFNTIGSIIIYPIRKIPIFLSVSLAKLSLRSKFYPFTYIVSVFYFIPGFVIFIFH